MIAILDSISRIFAKISAVLIVALASCLIGSLLISVFFRYVVGQALSWPEEISLILFAWMVLLAGSLGVREEFHVRLTIVVGRLPGPVRMVLDRAIVLAVIGFGAILIYSGYDLVERTAKHLTPTLRVPLDLLNYAAPVCGVLIVIHGLPKLFGRDGGAKAE
jgi:TRAP-type C4-dicarboxylate transport system permease small subunit